MATVNPICRGLKPYSRTKVSITPEMTMVSNPNSSPPNAPVRVAFINGMFGRMVSRLPGPKSSYRLASQPANLVPADLAR